ncbi:MAG TPA: hypothetical protein VJ875_06450 [Pyrinomonadaceae bacterium]|nr:hypothetical protein [Pyrinomonadaceae bacterium]
MSDHAESGTTTALMEKHKTLLASAEAECDRYQLLSTSTMP